MLTVLGKPRRCCDGFSRREFLAHTSCFGAFYALARHIPLPALATELAGDSRVSQTSLVDKGFAAVRKVGNGLYATISDPSKGLTTLCNGGFLVGRDAALLIEGFATPAGASFMGGAFILTSNNTLITNLFLGASNDVLIGSRGAASLRFETH